MLTDAAVVAMGDVARLRGREKVQVNRFGVAVVMNPDFGVWILNAGVAAEAEGGPFMVADLCETIAPVPAALAGQQI